MRALLESAGLRPAELQGEVAVVTGAGRGIGRAVARALAGLGAWVAVVDVTDDGEETAGLIRQAGGQALFVRADVSREEEVERLARRVAGEAGAATVVVSGAILCPVATVEEMSPELWDRVMAVNLRGAFLITRAFLPGMRALGRGTFVNMVSTEGMPGLTAYIASKQGLVGFTQSLAAELGEAGIRAVAFSPGLVETPGLLAAAERLAPLLGMTPEAFRSVSLHPAYNGLMPAEHAGLATAYLVARLAGEYHGESVSAYEVLERAGFLPNERRDAAGQPPAAAAPAPAPSSAPPRDLLVKVRRLAAILAEMAADFERLPLFVRPLARAGFKRKAGRTIQAWQQAAEALEGRVAAGEPVDAANLRRELDLLIGYVRSVPAETARFTRDAEVLRQTEERMRGYEADLMALCALLEEG